MSGTVNGRNQEWLYYGIMLLRTSPWRGVFLVLILSGAIGLPVLLGPALMPALPTYLDRGDCSQPCWQGLRPGYDDQSSVQTFIASSPLTALVLTDSSAESLGYLSWETRNFPSYDVYARIENGVLVQLELYVDGQLLLGDVIDEFGPPTHAEVCPRTATSFNYREADTATVYFFGGTVEVNVYRPDNRTGSIDPDMFVQRVVYYRPSLAAVMAVNAYVPPWQGFGRADYARQCQ